MFGRGQRSELDDLEFGRVFEQRLQRQQNRVAIQLLGRTDVGMGQRDVGVEASARRPDQTQGRPARQVRHEHPGQLRHRW